MAGSMYWMSSKAFFRPITKFMNGSTNFCSMVIDSYTALPINLPMNSYSWIDGDSGFGNS